MSSCYRQLITLFFHCLMRMQVPKHSSLCGNKENTERMRDSRRESVKNGRGHLVMNKEKAHKQTKNSAANFPRDEYT